MDRKVEVIVVDGAEGLEGGAGLAVLVLCAEELIIVLQRQTELDQQSCTRLSPSGSCCRRLQAWRLQTGFVSTDLQHVLSCQNVGI